MHEISQELESYLQKWHKTSTDKKAARGAVIQLTFVEFLTLLNKRQLTSLQKAIDENRLGSLQHVENEYAYVLTWRSYSARSENVFNIHTAIVCSRMKSAAINKPQAGDKLRPSHKASISKTTTGVPKSQDHCANISAGKKGVKITGWSEERKAARRLQNELKRAAKQAAKGE
jgi:hypothetical protein